MKTIDRVMRAYCSTRALTDEQAEMVRRELSLFIHELTFKPVSKVDDKIEALRSD